MLPSDFYFDRLGGFVNFRPALGAAAVEFPLFSGLGNISDGGDLVAVVLVAELLM